MPHRTPHRADDVERHAEARRILERAKRDGESLGTSALARTARQVSPGDAPLDDTAELWGRRVGRVLAVLFALYLAAMLADHVVRGMVDMTEPFR